MSLATSVLPQLVGGLRAPSAPERAEALGQLAQIVDTSFGEDALVLGEYLRMSGGIDNLVALLEDEEPMLYQTTLLLIGNLASDAVDPNSVLTKGVLKECGCFERLLPHLFSDDWLTLVYALGAVQNTCTDLEYVELMQEMGVVMRLQELAGAGDAQLERFAKGCLANMRETILAAAAAQQWRQRNAHAAATVLQADVRRFIAIKAARRLRDKRDKALPKAESPEEKMIRELRAEVEELKKEKDVANTFLDGVVQGMSPEEAQQLAAERKAKMEQLEEEARLRKQSEAEAEAERKRLEAEAKPKTAKQLEKERCAAAAAPRPSTDPALTSHTSHPSPRTTLAPSRAAVGPPWRARARARAYACA